jgi:hypothetical protein
MEDESLDKYVAKWVKGDDTKLLIKFKGDDNSIYAGKSIEGIIQLFRTR